MTAMSLLPLVLRQADAATRMRTHAELAEGYLEVYRENLNQTPRRRVLSRSAVSVDGASLPRHESRRGIAPWVAAKSCSKSLAATTYVPVARPADFKNCCMASGEYDGSDRHYFFQGVGSSDYAFEQAARQQCNQQRRCAAAQSGRWSAPEIVVVLS
jgi:hypothetical protein